MAYNKKKKSGHDSSSEPPTQTGIRTVNDHDYEIARRLQKEFDGEGQTHDTLRVETQECPGSLDRTRSAPNLRPVYPADIQAALDAMREFIGQAKQTCCHKCGTQLMNDFSVDSWCKKWQSTFNHGKTASICAAQCADENCGAFTCLGCKYEPRTGVFKAAFDDLVMDWCCQDGRLFGLWVLLAKYDLLEMKAQLRAINQVHSHRYSSRGSKKGTGYSEDVHEYSDDGFASQSSVFQDGDTGNGYYAKRGYGSPQAVDVSQVNAETDQVAITILGLVTRLLPDTAKQGSSTPTCLPAILILSLLYDKVAELLRNDSLRDVTKRGGLYGTVFDFLERLIDHPDLVYLVYQERYPKKETAGLEVLSDPPTQKGKTKAGCQDVLVLGYVNDGMSCSLAASMSNLVTQSQNFLKSFRTMNRVPDGRSGQAIFDIANRVAALHLAMAPHTSIIPDRQKTLTKNEIWTKFCKEHSVVWEPGISRQLCRNASDIALGLQYSPSSRIKRLVAEASEMSTSLPPNIFVKVDDSRPDVMKILIIGPDDTPYEGGVFEFDLVCNSEYPNVPPILDFRTTGGGKIGFNPNLYPNGKVYLSLLGTWSGSPEEQWQPRKSTILSVLVSIQAMIFCERPWENEPGLGDDATASFSGRSASEQYNREVQCLTTRFAILDWVREPGVRDSAWSHVLTQYFKGHADKIIRKARTWAVSNPDMTAWHFAGSTVNLLTELETALGSYGKRA